MKAQYCRCVSGGRALRRSRGSGNPGICCEREATILVGAGRFELPTSWSQTRRPAAGPRPEQVERGNVFRAVVPPERIELSSPAPEAGTLSTELQGHSTKRISRPHAAQQPSGYLAPGPLQSNTIHWHPLILSLSPTHPELVEGCPFKPLVVQKACLELAERLTMSGSEWPLKRPCISRRGNRA